MVTTGSKVLQLAHSVFGLLVVCTSKIDSPDWIDFNLAPGLILASFGYFAVQFLIMPLHQESVSIHGPEVLS